MMTAKPNPIEIKLKSLAFFEESMAPAISPDATLLFTCAAKMIATIASGQQQNTEIMAGTK
jgi:hypothetical protein